MGKTGSKMAVDTAMASLTDELWCGPICKYKLKKAAKAAKLAAEASTVEIKDELIKVGGRIGKFSGSVSFEDDDDDLVDDLGFKKFMKKTGKGISKVAKSDVGKAVIKVGGKVAVKAAKTALVGDLIKIGGKIGKFGGSISFEDDDDLVDDLALFTAIKEKRQAKKAAKKAAMQEVDDDLVDNLGKASVGFGKFKIGGSWADNSLTCDSEGNCMLKDE